MKQKKVSYFEQLNLRVIDGKPITQNEFKFVIKYYFGHKEKFIGVSKDELPNFIDDIVRKFRGGMV